VFRHNVDPGSLSEILENPNSNLPLGYHGSSAHPNLPLESEEAALRRQYDMLHREKDMVVAERNELRRKAAQGGFDLDAKGLDRLSSKPRLLSGRGGKPADTSDDSSDGVREDPDMSAAIGLLLKQQSEVSSQLENLLLKSKSGGLARGSNQKPGGHSLTRSASLRRQVSGKKIITARGVSTTTSADGSDSEAPARVPFQAQKSMPNTTASMNLVNSPFRQRGNQCCYALSNGEYHKEFGSAWGAKPANVVALGRGYVIIYDDGSVTWWDVPDLLDAKLKDQTASTQAVRYVALGADENYYVKFMDGKMEWCGPDAFGEALKRGVQKSRLLVDRVAFGPNQGWFILWSDGSFEHSRVPASLSALLSEMKPGQQIKDLSVGPNEEWFVIFKDNSVRADYLPDALFRILTEIQESSGRVRQVIFGESSSWYVRYWDGKV